MSAFRVPIILMVLVCASALTACGSAAWNKSGSPASSDDVPLVRLERINIHPLTHVEWSETEAPKSSGGEAGVNHEVRGSLILHLTGIDGDGNSVPVHGRISVDLEPFAKGIGRSWHWTADLTNPADARRAYDKVITLTTSMALSGILVSTSERDLSRAVSIRLLPDSEVPGTSAIGAYYELGP